MAKIIDLFNTSGAKLKTRQIKFEFEELPPFVLEFQTKIPCLECELEKHGLEYLNNDSNNSLEEIDGSLKRLDFKLEASLNDLLNTFGQNISCITCRSTTERLYKELIGNDKDHSLSLDPVLFKPNGILTFKASVLSSKSLFALFLINKEQFILDEFQINQSKKQQIRCRFHSLDYQKQIKQKNFNDWITFWNGIDSNEVRNELLTINANSLLKRINTYLTKNKFCSDCKLKVLVAFKIQIGEADLNNIDQSSYNPFLFDGIDVCEGTHIHVKNDYDFLTDLILKAKPEIDEKANERHAKTLENAQEEILICIGLYLFERFFNINQSIKTYEKSWRNLLYCSIFTLEKKIQHQIDDEKNIRNLELICAELERDEKKKKDILKAIKDKEIAAKKTKTKKKKERSNSAKLEVNKKEYNCIHEQKSKSKVENSIKITPNEIKTICNSNQTKSPPNLANSKILNEIIKSAINDCKCDDENDFIHNSTVLDQNENRMNENNINNINEKSETNECQKSCCLNIINYWNKLVEEDQKRETKLLESKKLNNIDNFDDEIEELEELILNGQERITQDEINDYYANKDDYLINRIKKRIELNRKFELLKSKSTLKIKLRHLKN